MNSGLLYDRIRTVEDFVSIEPRELYRYLLNCPANVFNCQEKSNKLSSKNLHISQVTYLPQLLRSLKSKGVSTDRMIKRSRLHNFDLSNPDAYIPSSFLYHFLEQVQHSQGLHSIAGEFFNDFSLKGAGAYGESLFVQPTLLQLMQGGVKFQHLLRTDQKLGFSIQGNTVEFSFNMLGDPSQKKTILEDIALAQTFDTFRVAGGENWFPSEIHLTTKYVKRLDKLLLSGNYKLYCNQPVNKIVFPLEIALKDLSPISYNQIISLDLENNLSSQITRLLQNASPGNRINFNQISDISDMSLRTLSRILAEEGVTFNQLASNVMFNKASHLLTTTNLSVTEISQHLGYTKSTNFVRAFKQASKFTPDLFRAQC